MALVAEMALLCPSIDSKTQNQPDDNFVDINNCTQTHSPLAFIKTISIKTEPNHIYSQAFIMFIQTIIEIV